MARDGEVEVTEILKEAMVMVMAEIAVVAEIKVFKKLKNVPSYKETDVNASLGNPQQTRPIDNH